MLRLFIGNQCCHNGCNEISWARSKTKIPVVSEMASAQALDFDVQRWVVLGFHTYLVPNCCAPPQRLSSMINSERIKFINWIIQHPRSRFFLGSGKSGNHQPGVDSEGLTMVPLEKEGLVGPTSGLFTSFHQAIRWAFPSKL